MPATHAMADTMRGAKRAHPLGVVLLLNEKVQMSRGVKFICARDATKRVNVGDTMSRVAFVCLGHN